VSNNGCIKSGIKVTDSDGREFFISRGAKNSWWPKRTERAETPEARHREGDEAYAIDTPREKQAIIVGVLSLS
jgi:hypothetical protein